MNKRIVPAAAIAAKGGPEWPGYQSVAETIKDMVLDMVQCFGFGSYGERKEAELVPLTDLVRVLDGQVTRREIVDALDALQADGKIALWFSDSGVCAKPKSRPRWTKATA